MSNYVNGCRLRGEENQGNQLDEGTPKALWCAVFISIAFGPADISLLEKYEKWKQFIFIQL